MTEINTSSRDKHRVVELPCGGRSEVWLARRGERVEMHNVQRDSRSGGGGTTNWARCSQSMCVGEALPNSGACFEHSTYEQRQVHLQQVRNSKQSLSLRGTSISQKLWDEISVSPVFEGERPVVAVNLSGCEIHAKVRFDKKEFDHSINLYGASIFAGMEYRQCKFNVNLSARHAHFDAGPPASK